jgi:hypothetical protein
METLNLKVNKILSGLLLLIIVSFLSACAGNDIIRSDFSAPCIFKKAGDCANNAIQHYQPNKNNEYYLGFVEFDDQGQMRDRYQLESVLKQFYPVASEKGVLLVTFVHGWHHGAELGDPNITQFRKLLARISRTESKAMGAKARTVLGVYVAWRGDSISIPYLNGITFWDRKNTAHEVGANGVSEVFIKLEEIVNVKAGVDDPGKKTPSRLVVIGHSFGGAVTYTALQNILADRYYDSRPGKTSQGDAKGFGDIVILVNPAFEALRFATLYDIGQQVTENKNCRSYFAGQVPRLAILTSETDLATKWAFPAGRFFSTLLESHTSLKRFDCKLDAKTGRYIAKPLMVQEGSADRTAVGHFEPFMTHRLKSVSDRTKRIESFDYRLLSKMWLGQKSSGTLKFESADLVHKGKTHPFNPYLNVYVDEDLMDGHNDIWGEGITSFIRDLIHVSTMPQGKVGVSDGK